MKTLAPPVGPRFDRPQSLPQCEQVGQRFTQCVKPLAHFEDCEFGPEPVELPFRFTIDSEADVSYTQFLYVFINFAFRFKQSGRAVGEGLVVDVGWNDSGDWVEFRAWNPLSEDYDGPLTRLYIATRDGGPGDFDEACYL